MSTYTYLVKFWTCQRLDDINTAILENDPNWEGLTNADQIISIQWVPEEQRYYVWWRVRKWMNGGPET